MTLSCSSTDFENDSDFRPSRAGAASDSRLCRSIRCVYRLLIVQLFLQAGFIQRFRHPYHHVKG